MPSNSVSRLLSTTFQTSRVSLGQINFGIRQSGTGKKGLISAYKKISSRYIFLFWSASDEKEVGVTSVIDRAHLLLSIRIIANFNYRLFGLLYFIHCKKELVRITHNSGLMHLQPG